MSTRMGIGNLDPRFKMSRSQGRCWIHSRFSERYSAVGMIPNRLYDRNNSQIIMSAIHGMSGEEKIQCRVM